MRYDSTVKMNLATSLVACVHIAVGSQKQSSVVPQRRSIMVLDGLGIAFRTPFAECKAAWQALATEIILCSLLYCPQCRPWSQVPSTMTTMSGPTEPGSPTTSCSSTKSTKCYAQHNLLIILNYRGRMSRRRRANHPQQLSSTSCIDICTNRCKSFPE